MEVWKKSEILKNKKFRIVLLLELLLLLVPVVGILRGDRTVSTLADARVALQEGVRQEETGYSVDGSSDVNGTWLEMSGFALTPGTYTYYVTYDAEDNEIRSISRVTTESTGNCWKMNFPCIPEERRLPVISM